MSSANEIIFWGGTGHAKVLREAIADRFRLSAIFDNRAIPSPLPGVPLFVGEEGLISWLRSRPERALSPYFAIAIGGAGGRDRIHYRKFLEARGMTAQTILHPRAWIATDALVSDGSQILAGAMVATHVRVGRQVIVNTGASIDHDCILRDGVHVGPGAVLAGEVVVEECAFIGAGATVLPRVKIGADAVVGAGAVVTKEVPPGVTVMGVPARVFEHAPRNELFPLGKKAPPSLP